MALPPGWIIHHPDQSNRFLYRNQKESFDTWIRPTPPPGYTGRWPNLLHAAHILIKCNESRNIRSHNRRKGCPEVNLSSKDAKKFITKIRDDILAEETPLKRYTAFRQRAQAYSDCSSCDFGGDLGWEKPEVLAQNFVKHVFMLKYDEYSEPFQTESGWHIAVRLDGTFYNPQFPTHVLLKDPPPFEVEFGKKISASRALEIYRHIYEAEVGKTKDQWERIINDLIDISVEPEILYTYVNGMLFNHPTDSKVIDFCRDIVEKHIPNRMEHFMSKILVYTCNPRYWKETCRNSEIVFKKVGFTYNFGQEWCNYAKRFQADPPKCCEVLLKALTSGVSLEDNELLKFAQPYALGDSVEAGKLDARIGQIYRNRLINLLQRCDPKRYKDDFDNLLGDIIASYEGADNSTKDYIGKISNVVYAPQDKVITYLSIIKENRIDAERHRNFERKNLNTRSDISNGLFDDSDRVMIRDPDNKKYEKWMGYLKNEKEMSCIIEDEEFYNDLIDYSFRLSLTELWWIPSVWMRYWEFLNRIGREIDAQNILALAQETFQNNASFELERADIFINDGKYEEARKVYSKLMERGEPLLTAAMILDFKCVILQKGESEALQSLSERVDYITPKFIINTAKMCSNSEIAWSLYQLGIDTFDNDLDIILAAADFLAEQRDSNNTRLLLQQTSQTLNEKIKKRLFEFELEHIAPPNHLNETQKSFKQARFDFILYLQRYRFKNLYPLNPDELVTTAYCTMDFTIDFLKDNDSNYITAIPPYGVPLEKMKKRQEYNDFYDRALQRFTTQPATKVRQQYLSQLQDKLSGIFNVRDIDVDEIIEEIKKLSFTN